MLMRKPVFYRICSFVFYKNYHKLNFMLIIGVFCVSFYQKMLEEF